MKNDKSSTLPWKCYTRADPVLTVFQLTWCFRKTFLLTHKFGTAWAIEMTADREEWSELPICATIATHTRSGTSVIRRSNVPPRAWVGPTNNWSQPERVAKSKAATHAGSRWWTQPLLMMAIQITHKQERGTDILRMHSGHWC